MLCLGEVMCMWSQRETQVPESHCSGWGYRGPGDLGECSEAALGRSMQLGDTNVSCCQMVFMHPGSSRNINDVMYSLVHAREGEKAQGLLVLTYTPWGCASMTALFFIYHFPSVFFCAFPCHPTGEADVFPSMLRPQPDTHSQLHCPCEGPGIGLAGVRAPVV